MANKIISIFLATIIYILASNTFASENEEGGLTSGQIAIIDIALHSLVNLYSTNQLIVDAYGNSGIPQKEALAAIQRNRNFLKIISRYAMDIKRQGAKGDKKATDFINKITEICTSIDLHIGSIVDYVEKNDKTSVNQLEKNREKVEKLINELLSMELY